MRGKKTPIIQLAQQCILGLPAGVDYNSSDLYLLEDNLPFCFTAATVSEFSGHVLVDFHISFILCSLYWACEACEGLQYSCIIRCQ